MKEFQGRARQGVNDETFGTSNGGGSLQDDQHHGGGDELFSSEVSSLSRDGGEDLKILKISHTWVADRVCGGPDRVGHLS